MSREKIYRLYYELFKEVRGRPPTTSRELKVKKGIDVLYEINLKRKQLEDYIKRSPDLSNEEKKYLLDELKFLGDSLESPVRKLVKLQEEAKRINEDIEKIRGSLFKVLSKVFEIKILKKKKGVALPIQNFLQRIKEGLSLSDETSKEIVKTGQVAISMYDYFRISLSKGIDYKTVLRQLINLREKVPPDLQSAVDKIINSFEVVRVLVSQFVTFTDEVEKEISYVERKVIGEQVGFLRKGWEKAKEFVDRIKSFISDFISKAVSRFSDFMGGLKEANDYLRRAQEKILRIIS